jgi:hypothetical protein
MRPGDEAGEKPSGFRLRLPTEDVTMCAAIHAGMLAAHNDDTFLIADLERNATGRKPGSPMSGEVGQEGVLLMVCDGIGGAAGEVAAWIGSETIIAALRRTGGSDGNLHRTVLRRRCDRQPRGFRGGGRRRYVIQTALSGLLGPLVARSSSSPSKRDLPNI